MSRKASGLFVWCMNIICCVKNHSGYLSLYHHCLAQYKFLILCEPSLLICLTFHVLLFDMKFHILDNKYDYANACIHRTPHMALRVIVFIVKTFDGKCWHLVSL